MRTGHAKFKQLRQWSGLGVALLLVACAPATPRKQAPTQPPAKQPLAQLSVPSVPANKDVMAQLLQGEFAISHGDLAAASQAYAKAAQVSTDPAVAERAAALAMAVHDDKAAKAAIDRWQALGAPKAGLAQARAELALATGDTDVAREQLLLLIQTGGPDAWRTVGRVLMRARDTAQAGRLLESLATPERLPADASAWLAMSELADRLGRHAYAGKLADAAIARFRTGETYAWAAQLKLSAGDREGALKLYAEAFKRDPRNERVRLGYAAALGQAGRNAEAGKILAKGPQTAATFAARAGFAARAKDKSELRRIYHALSKAKPEVRNGNYYLLGQLADMLGRPREAIDWYAQVPDDDTHAFDAAMRRAVLLHGQGERRQAHLLIAGLQADYADDPKRLAHADQLDAELYLREQNYPAAIDSYTNAIQLQPRDTGLLYGRGIAHAQAGQMDAAIADWRALLDIKPDDVDAANALGYTLADLNRDLPEAERLIGAARKARPKDPAIADSWGWLLYRQGHLEQAETVLRSAWKGHKDADVGAHLAEVLWKLGRTGEARKILAEARKLDPHSEAVRTLTEKMSP